MSSIPHRKALVAGLVAAVLLALVAWLVGRGIRSPAQVASDTAPPEPSLITVPVERRTLVTEIIVRGTVRYGAPQKVVLPISSLKPGSSIVSRPPRVGGTLSEGSLAMSLSGRPVFAMRGAEPMHRDLGPGAVGPDVRQLEQALQRVGLSPGTVDDRYDGSTEAAVAAWYRKAGWTPFGATDVQADQLRTAQAAAASARDAVLQARLAQETAAQGATPAEVNQARIDAATADGAVVTARLAIETARTRSATTRDAAARLAALASGPTAGARGQADVAAADAEAVAKQAALTTAIDEQAAAQRALDTAPLAPPDSPPPDLEALRAALRQATEAVPVASRGAEAAASAAVAARAAAQDATDQAATDAVVASRDAELAAAELASGREALASAGRQASLARKRVDVLTGRVDTTLLAEVVAAAESEARRTDADVARLAAIAGVQVPADELLFFPTLPLRVDAVTRRRGDSAAGRVMTVSNSELAADSSLALNDAKLVRVGARVAIEEQDLGIRVPGTVARVADRPGTNKVDPTRVYFEVRPKSAPARLVGASVRLKIAVRSTKGAVLAVPLSALSVGAGGESRVQVDRAGGGAEYVSVVPGLAANGLVEVRPQRRADLKADDLVIVGAGGASGLQVGGGGARPAETAPEPIMTAPSTGTAPGTGTATAPGTGTGPGTP